MQFVQLCGQNVLKIRSGISGLNIPFFKSEKWLLDPSFDNEYYAVRRLEKVYPIDDFHVFIEYERHHKFSINMGYSLSAIGCGLSKLLFSADPPSKTVSEVYVAYDLHRLPLFFTLALRDNRRFCNPPPEKRFFIQPDVILGASFMFLGKNFEKNKDYVIPLQNSIITDDSDVIDFKYFRNSPQNKGIGLIGGLGFRIRNRLHEIGSLSAYYELGIINLLEVRMNSYKNNQLLDIHSAFSNGSQLSVRLTFPVFTYNFTKKKFYRD